MWRQPMKFIAGFAPIRFDSTDQVSATAGRTLQHTRRRGQDDLSLNDTCAWTPNRGGPTERAPKEEIRSSENPKFRIFDKIAEKKRSRGFLKNPSVESVAGEQTQLFTEGFPVIFHEGPFSSWNHLLV